MRRWAAGSAIAAVLVAAGFVVAHETGARAAFGQLIVRGRVTGVDGKPVRGVKVWLMTGNATGSDAPTFSVRLMPAQAGRTIDLRLAPQ